MYTVPENNRSVPLCIDVGAIDSVDRTYTITAQQKNPPQANGEQMHALIESLSSTYNFIIHCQIYHMTHKVLLNKRTYLFN